MPFDFIFFLRKNTHTSTITYMVHLTKKKKKWKNENQPTYIYTIYKKIPFFGLEFYVVHKYP